MTALDLETWKHAFPIGMRSGENHTGLLEIVRHLNPTEDGVDIRAQRVEARCAGCSQTKVYRPSEFRLVLSCGCSKHERPNRRDFPRGYRWGRLSLLEMDVPPPAGDRGRFVRLACDCGNPVEVALTNLVSHRTRSCGCAAVGPGSPAWEGCSCGRVSGAWLAMMRTGARARSRKSGDVARYAVNPEVDDPEFVCSLFDTQKSRCSISHMPIQGDYVGESHPRGLIWKPQRRTASLDRVDPTRGYTRDNVTLVHILVNIAKRDMQHDEFVQLCRAVAKANPSEDAA